MKGTKLSIGILTLYPVGKQANTPMCKWAWLMKEKKISGRQLLSMTELALELLGVPQDDIENCQKRVEDLRMDMRMVKKIKRTCPCRLDCVEETRQDEEMNLQETNRSKRDHAMEVTPGRNSCR
eukprot:TRINITY_DN10181_c0_g1_i1.p1 TRINITY_DN10181_c0_g1~~TRINITY_DN10181_c0_g1_i1.p1  ORF type:complete len:124 (+),score=18.41 TRINITY_DN10181_c0_g1_i1:163-534(+)